MLQCMLLKVILNLRLRRKHELFCVSGVDKILTKFLLKDKRNEF